jgi:hypothetical protein
MIPLTVTALSQLDAALAIVILVSAYFISSMEGDVEVLVSHRAMKSAGLTLGVVYLAYVVVEFAGALILR